VATDDRPPLTDGGANVARVYDYLLLRHEALRYRAG
jgi:hypothetical protein